MKRERREERGAREDGEAGRQAGRQHTELDATNRHNNNTSQKAKLDLHNCNVTNC